MEIKKTSLLLLAAVFAVACEKQIDIDIKNQEAQVVVMGQNEVGKAISVDLTYSRPTFSTFYVRDGESYFQEITDATVTLGIDGGAALTASQNNGTYTFAHVPMPGERLTLTVSMPGKDAVSASATVPQSPAISNIDTSHSNADSYYELSQTAVQFTLADPAGTADYYSIRLREVATTVVTQRDSTGAILSQDTTVDSHYQWFSCTDYLLVSNTSLDLDDPTETNTFYGSELLFTDATINGQNHRINLKQSGYGCYSYEYDDIGADAVEYTTTIDLFLEVTALTRDLYLYRQTMENYDYDEILSFFSEPTQIHSNIDGGIGIFGVSNKTVKQVYSVTLQ